ncbi:hypothetical protein ACFOSC_28950 [Streptantibioticus rubrisoli]|uniref:Uncharacterized protein n=1 Tax=Streptantibioticus rubrisoli TaxID=1387313 RepID=A0ABT1PGJ2_9ACTN|nr:hypothetical protein [Streptantibioticus rubrisoli]MCQ4044486.1 hypothetical protein [Streptantibioticus rubrisoli]
MTTQTTQLVPAKHKGHRPWGKQPAAVELSAISVRPAVHYTRPWSAATEDVPFAFRLAVLPVRAMALVVLWATSSPQRLSVAVALSSVLALVLLG